MFKQVASINFDPVIYQGGPLYDWLGWCMAYVEQSAGVRYVYSTAADGWNKVGGKHTDKNLPVGLWVPIWLSGFRGMGHVQWVKKNANGSVESYTSPNTRKPSADHVTANSLDDLVDHMRRYWSYDLSYLGWSEFVGPKRIVEWVEAPIAKNARKTTDLVRARDAANTQAAVYQEVDANSVVEMKGFVTNGEPVNGNTTWFVTARSGKFMTAEGFADKGTHDLADMTVRPLAPNQRKVEAATIMREKPTTESKTVGMAETGKVFDVRGYAKGLAVEGNSIWFNVDDGKWMWSGGFTNKSADGLKEVVADNKSEASQPTKTTAADTSKLVIDISNHQADSVINVFTKVAGVIVKAGHVGASYGGDSNKKDPKLAKFVDAARKAGKMRGMYWLPYFDTIESAKEEAQRFVNVVNEVGNKDGEALFVDIEPDFSGNRAQLDVFINHVTKLTGKRCGIYAGKAMVEKLGLENVDWYPHYGVVENYAHGAFMHQYTETGKVDGYDGNLDLNTVKDMSRLIELGTPIISKPNDDFAVRLSKLEKIVEGLVNFLSNIFKGVK